MSGSSQYKFGVLAKIVKYMRSRHQEGDDHPLSLDEILDETNQLDVGSKVKQVSIKCSRNTIQLCLSEVFVAVSMLNRTGLHEAELVKKFPDSYGSQRLITVFTKVYHQPLS
jgi:hypothetical protein